MLLGRIIVLSIVGFSLWYYQFESLIIVIFVFILVVPMEKIFPRHQGQNVRRPKWKLDVTYALSAPFLNIFGVIFAIIIGYIFFAELPTLVMLIGAALVIAGNVLVLWRERQLGLINQKARAQRQRD